MELLQYLIGMSKHAINKLNKKDEMHYRLKLAEYGSTVQALIPEHWEQYKAAIDRISFEFNSDKFFTGIMNMEERYNWIEKRFGFSIAMEATIPKEEKCPACHLSRSNCQCLTDITKEALG
jgi:hypothetical protein